MPNHIYTKAKSTPGTNRGCKRTLVGRVMTTSDHQTQALVRRHNVVHRELTSPLPVMLQVVRTLYSTDDCTMATITDGENMYDCGITNRGAVKIIIPKYAVLAVHKISTGTHPQWRSPRIEDLTMHSPSAGLLGDPTCWLVFHTQRPQRWTASQALHRHCIHIPCCSG